MNLIKTIDHIINLDHVSRISYSTDPEPKLVFYFAIPPKDDFSTSEVQIDGVEAGEIMKDLERLPFIFSGLPKDAMESERKKRKEKAAATARAFGQPIKRKLAL